MVLLTSSAISVAISGAIICAFTFLLFLSGYVLQQRTVRSLQEALRQPPEPKPIPTLPPQFLEAENLSTGDRGQVIEDLVIGDDGGQRIEEVLVPLSVEDLSTQQTQLATNANIRGATWTLDTLQATPDNLLPTASPRSQDVLQISERLAYILTLSEPSDLCSAALFAQQQRSSSTLSSRPAIIFLYPSSWESSLRHYTLQPSLCSETFKTPPPSSTTPSKSAQSGAASASTLSSSANFNETAGTTTDFYTSSPLVW